jgi:putative DNA primase/helicase
MSSHLKLIVVTTPRPVLTIVKALGLSANSPTKALNARKTTQLTSVGPSVNVQGGAIPASGRNNFLTSLAGTMRRRGMSEAAMDAALQAENISRFQPPLDQSEVCAIAKSVARYAATTSQQDVMRSLTDTGNATRFGMLYQDQARYVTGLGWHIWDGLKWRCDEGGQIIELAKKVAREIYLEGEALEDDTARRALDKHSRGSQQQPRLKAMVELSQSLPTLAAKASDLDSHDMLLGVANGVVNLKTGKLQPACRDLLLTRHSSVKFDAAARCPLFNIFIGQVTGGDKTLATYLQRVLGYSLTGNTTEQCLFFLYGNGANGKSTFLNIAKELVGADLAKQTPSETLMAKRPAASNDLARLHNVRVVIANEVEDGSLLAESLVKQMTGGEALTARFLYTEHIEFIPKFKLFIAGNHKPMIHGRDGGIWRRVRLIPFEVTVPANKRDKNLAEKLRAELPGILNWAIKGCRDWQKSGLNEPTSVTDAVTNYRNEMDVIAQWIDAKCKTGVQFESRAAHAYSSYRFWAESNGYRPMASGTFGRDLGSRFKRVKRNDGNYYEGIQVSASMFG